MLESVHDDSLFDDEPDEAVWVDPVTPQLNPRRLASFTYCWSFNEVLHLVLPPLLMVAHAHTLEPNHEDKLFDDEPDEAVWVEVDMPSF